MYVCVCVRACVCVCVCVSMRACNSNKLQNIVQVPFLKVLESIATVILR